MAKVIWIVWCTISVMKNCIVIYIRFALEIVKCTVVHKIFEYYIVVVHKIFEYYIVLLKNHYFQWLLARR